MEAPTSIDESTVASVDRNLEKSIIGDGVQRLERSPNAEQWSWIARLFTQRRGSQRLAADIRNSIVARHDHHVRC